MPSFLSDAHKRVSLTEVALRVALSASLHSNLPQNANVQSVLEPIFSSEV